MTSDDRNKKALAARPGSPTYEVGYGKPPKNGRFKPGQSGNPRGRPKGAKNKRPALHEERLKTIVIEEAYRNVKVRDGDKNVSIPVAQAVVRAVSVNAARGDHRSQKLFSELVTATEAANYRLHNEYLETAINYKVDWERELERCKRLGVKAPEPLPHPDDIEIDMNTGEVIIKGPMTREEKAQREMIVERKAGYEEELAYCRETLQDESQSEYWQQIERDLAHAEKMLSIIEKLEQQMWRRPLISG